MLTKENILSKIKKNYPHLATEYGIKQIGLFGSFVNGDPTNKSDIDLIIEFEQPIGLRFIELAEYLEHLLGRKVDILTRTGIQGIRIPGIADKILENAIYVQ
jgi:predicted nucleotidyltransferase